MRNIDFQSVRPAPKARVCSAKGAAFNQILGQRPRIPEIPSVSAESAIHRHVHIAGGESRLQRSCIRGTSIPGAVPQAKSEIAPLALHTDQNVSGAGRTGHPPLPKIRRAGKPMFRH
jgi:hypothetical protein